MMMVWSSAAGAPVPSITRTCIRATTVSLTLTNGVTAEARFGCAIAPGWIVTSAIVTRRIVRICRQSYRKTAGQSRRSKLRSRVSSRRYAGIRAAFLRLGPGLLYILGKTREQRVDPALDFTDDLRILRRDVVAFIRIGCEVVKLGTRERIVQASFGRRRRVSGGVVPR